MKQISSSECRSFPPASLPRSREWHHGLVYGENKAASAACRARRRSRRCRSGHSMYGARMSTSSPPCSGGLRSRCSRSRACGESRRQPAIWKRRRRSRSAPLACALLVYLLTPFHVGPAGYLDVRLAPMLALLLIPLLRPEPGTTNLGNSRTRRSISARHSHGFREARERRPSRWRAFSARSLATSTRSSRR